MTVEEFAQVLLEQTKARIAARYSAEQALWEEVEVIYGPKYAKVNIGPGHPQMSGKYMVENATGIIFGIKGYGRVHKGHRYGTLDTVADWYWGGYTGERVEGVQFLHLSPDAKWFITDRAIAKFQGELIVAAPEISRILDEFEQEGS